MSATDSYRKLGLKPGASKKDIKAAFRKLALKYHPDLNDSKDAKREFQEIIAAYEEILLEYELVRENLHYRQDVEDVIRAERAKVQQRVRAKEAKLRREKERFEQSEWHDILLFFKYFFNGLAILLSILAVLVPILLAILIDPVILFATIYFLVIGSFMLIYIYKRRKRWFRLGKFNTRWKDIRGFFKMPASKPSVDVCCYTKGRIADGKPYTIELLKTLGITLRNTGVMNHGARYKNSVKRVVMPRSTKAQFWHRMLSLIKLSTIFLCLFLVPIDSILWRFIVGIMAGGLFSVIICLIVGVKSKANYLFTPGLIVKLAIWIFVLLKISIIGPGLNIQLTTTVYAVLAMLLFLLDMAFDLIMGLFPFYPKFFKPIIKQGKVLNGLYQDGYQNYQELPVYSVLFPLYNWLF